MKNNTIFLTAFSTLLLISIGTALKCYQGTSEIGFLEEVCPEKGMKCMEVYDNGEIGKFCGHGCKDLHEVEQAPFQCYECASDLCNTNTDTETIKCVIGDSRHKFAKAICHNFGGHKNRKCVTATGGGGAFIAKACLPGCEEAQKIYAGLANRDASYASIPKMEKCDECDHTDYCNDENQHDEF